MPRALCRYASRRRKLPDEGLSVSIRHIGPGDSFAGFKLGDAAFTPLKTFITRHAKAYEDRGLARTYAAFNEADSRLVGYITLVCGEVVTGDGDDPLIQENGLKYLYNHYPAIKIARLAVDHRYRKIKLGQVLVELAFGVAKDVICPAVGCRFIMVDSKQASVNFYAKCGFTLLDTPENRSRDEPVMYVDLSKASPAQAAA